jgi:hypothetical protein
MPLEGNQHRATPISSGLPKTFSTSHTVGMHPTKANNIVKKKITLFPKKTRSTVDKLSVMLQGLKIKPHSPGTGLRAVNSLHPGPKFLQVPVLNAYTQFRNHGSADFKKQHHRHEASSSQSKSKTRLQLIRRSRSLSLIPYSVPDYHGGSTRIHSNPSTPSKSPTLIACWESPPAQHLPLSFSWMQRINGVALSLEGSAESPLTHPDDLDSPMPNSSASSLYPDDGETPPGTPMDGVTTGCGEGSGAKLPATLFK